MMSLYLWGVCLCGMNLCWWHSYFSSVLWPIFPFESHFCICVVFLYEPHSYMNHTYVWATFIYDPYLCMSHIHIWTIFMYEPHSYMNHTYVWAIFIYEPCSCMSHVHIWTIFMYGLYSYTYSCMNHIHLMMNLLILFWTLQLWGIVYRPRCVYLLTFQLPRCLLPSIPILRIPLPFLPSLPLVHALVVWMLLLSLLWQQLLCVCRKEPGPVQTWPSGSTQ